LEELYFDIRCKSSKAKNLNASQLLIARKKIFEVPRSSVIHSEDIVGGREETTKFARSTKVLRWLRGSRRGRAENTKGGSKSKIKRFYPCLRSFKLYESGERRV